MEDGSEILMKICDGVYKVGNRYHVGITRSFKTLTEAVRFRNKLDEFLPPDKDNRFRDRERRYIYQVPNGNWIIRKTIKGKKYSFGTFHSYEDAVHERDYLENIEWDYSNMY